MIPLKKRCRAMPFNTARGHGCFVHVYRPINYVVYDHMLIIIINPHRLLLQMWCGLCCVTSVSLSVCVSVGHCREFYKNGQTDRGAVWDVDSSGPKWPCIRGNHGPPTRKGNFGDHNWTCPDLPALGILTVSARGQVDKVMVATARIAAAHRSIHRIRQVSPLCTLI